jgi:hypothetical protein
MLWTLRPSRAAISRATLPLSPFSIMARRYFCSDMVARSQRDRKKPASRLRRTSLVPTRASVNLIGLLAASFQTDLPNCCKK